MQTTKFLATVSLAGLFAGLMAVSANAQTALPTCNISRVGGPILAGHVSSAQEGLMEGVLVSLKRESSTVTTTVASNANGEFSFPPGRLEPAPVT